MTIVWEEDELGMCGEVYCDGCDKMLGICQDPMDDFGLQMCHTCPPPEMCCTDDRLLEVEEEWYPSDLERMDQMARDWEDNASCPRDETNECAGCWWVNHCYGPWLAEDDFGMEPDLIYDVVHGLTLDDPYDIQMATY